MEKRNGMPNVRIGTCSWTDRSLIDSKRFYPRGASTAEERLRHYASQFPFVEVDSSYYAMPGEHHSRQWVERTPPGFVFNLKAFRALTQHRTPLKALPPDIANALASMRGETIRYADLPAEIVAELWARFIRAIQPLALAGKLGALHFQFPPWFRASRENLAYLERVRHELGGFTVAIEFRHASWFEDDHCEATLEFERDRAFVNVVVDEPQGFWTSIPAIWRVTSPSLAIVRLHGRNHATWMAKGLGAASERFNYDYGDDEIAALCAPIRAIAAEVDTVHVVVNVNHADQGIRAGRALFRRLHDIAVPPEEVCFSLA
jgi:uncharacterized protein YecE (DUF72 family)